MFKFLIGLITVVVLLVICWMITEYWLRSVRRFSKEKMSSLSIWDRVAFTVEGFCEVVNHKKDFRKMRMRDEMGTRYTKIVTDEKKGPEISMKAGKEKESMKRDKKYRIKENM